MYTHYWQDPSEAASMLVLYTFHHRGGKGWGREKL